jgi:hypothetical protein
MCKANAVNVLTCPSASMIHDYIQQSITLAIPQNHYVRQLWISEQNV